MGRIAQTDGLTVNQDGDATQHQGFHILDGHCRPPATYGKDVQVPASMGGWVY